MRHTYNMDEKGFLIGILSKQKRIFSRIKYEKGGIKQMIHDGNREWITSIACICADGTSLTPGLIYKAAGNSLQDSWLQDFDPAVHKAFFTSSSSGWTNDDIGLKWLTNIFDRETQKKARSSIRLLLLDGHGSHVSRRFIEYCDAHRIHLALYPPHSTHTLQPLDVGVFKSLSSAYSRELANFMHASQGLTSITKRDFYRLFHRAWDDSITPANILSSFNKCGIHPFDPNRVLSRFDDKTTERPSSSDSCTSVLSASDWRKIERLLREVVDNIYDKKAAALSQALHSMSVETTLLRHENGQLKEALINEKKRRQRSRPLLLEKPADYHGGAIWYSPRKIQEVRDLQAHKDEGGSRSKRQKRLVGSSKSNRKRRSKFRLRRGSVRGKLQRRRSLELRLKRELSASQKRRQ